MRQIQRGETPEADYDTAIWDVLKESYEWDDLGEGWNGFANSRSNDVVTPPSYFVGWLEGAMAVFDQVENEL